jgi:drug/metabolite transporter (DMT)-like permease
MNDASSHTGPTRALFLATENLQGIVLMVIARAVFATSDSFTKLASAGLPATEVVFLRNAMAFPIVVAVAWRFRGLKHLRAIRDPIVFWRSVLEGIGLIAFVLALPHVTIGQSTVIMLTVPIILVALSAVVFKEDVDGRRWAAIVVGFIGVFLVAGPLGGTPNAYLLLTQLTALTWAIRDLITSRIVGHIPTVTVSLYATLIGGLVALPGAAIESWQPVVTTEGLYLLGAGVFVAAANLLYISALRTGAISVVAPFRYTAAIWASLAGFIVWRDIPDVWGVTGTLFIIGSGLYTFYRELERVKALKLAKAV